LQGLWTPAAFGAELASARLDSHWNLRCDIQLAQMLDVEVEPLRPKVRRFSGYA
jgi:hypothetical protein